MNKVYFAHVYGESCGAYIAASNIKEAKKIAYSCDLINSFIDNYIDLRVEWKKGIKTELKGELDIFEINKLGLTWWSCPECDSEDFTIIHDEKYRCNKCDKEFEIPYEEY